MLSMFQCLHTVLSYSLIESEATNGLDDAYHQAVAYNRRIGGSNGIDAVLQTYNLDALVMPIWGSVTTPAGLSDIEYDLCHAKSGIRVALVGYPMVVGQFRPFQVVVFEVWS